MIASASSARTEAQSPQPDVSWKTASIIVVAEAYYHGVFLLCLLFLIRRKFVLSLAMAALLSMSHPFTGLSLALILTVYSACEVAPIWYGPALWSCSTIIDSRCGDADRLGSGCAAAPGGLWALR
jgi:hypothetical protein